MSNKYPTQTFYSDTDEGYISIAPDLPGCSAFGETPEESLHELQDAIQAWISAAKKVGNPIPPPSSRQQEELPSGKVLLRLPKTLHAQIIDRAARDGSSLNTCVVMLLSKALHERQPAPHSVVIGQGPIAIAAESQLREVAEQWLAAHTEIRQVWSTTLKVDSGSAGSRQTLSSGGSVVNLLTLPANKPVIVMDD
jgi:predicted RNase H-like HicB family nuclease